MASGLGIARQNTGTSFVLVLAGYDQPSLDHNKPEPSFNDLEGAAVTFFYLVVSAKPFPTFAPYVAVGPSKFENYWPRSCASHGCFKFDCTWS